MPDETIEIASLAEKWRLECPRGDSPGDGHTNWFPIDGKFRCRACAEARKSDPAVDPEYEQLRDKKTGALVSREQVTLAIEREASATGV